MSTDLTMFNDGNAFNQGMTVAKVFTNSNLVPQHMRGKIEDCFIALNMAQVMGEHPLIVMQNIYMVSGKAGWSSSYMIARANKSGIFKGPINWRKTGAGDTLEIEAYATLQNGEEVTATASMKMAKAEGWTKNPKYNSMPEHMLRYRAATFLIRLFAPEVMLGIPMTEENEDVQAAQAKDVTPKPTRTRLASVPTTEPHGQLTQQLEQSIAAEPETPHNPATGEVYTPTQVLLDGDEIPDFDQQDEAPADEGMVPDEVYTLTYRGGATESYATPKEFEDAYKKVARAGTPEAREILRALNINSIARAKQAMGLQEDAA